MGAATPLTSTPLAANPMDTCSSVRSTCALINRVSVVSLWVSVLYSSLHIWLLCTNKVLYEHVHREKQRLCDFCNDYYATYSYMSSLVCINRGGKMIYNFCYSHLIMINTLYTCTVQVRVQYTVLLLLFARLNFIWGGLSPPSPNDASPLIITECAILK